MNINTALENKHSAANCPSCAQTMQTIEVESRLVGTLEIDFCAQCFVIWFDRAESSQLAPGAVIELFKIVNTHSDQSRLPLSQALPCPRCKKRLSLTHDVCRSGPISYYRCPEHGRLTPFYQFLKEKQFIRRLSPTEIGQLRVQVKQIKCSGCGGSIDLEKNTACSYCGAAISVLDADAVTKGMEVWAAAAERRRNSSPAEISEATMRLAAAHEKLAQQERKSNSQTQFSDVTDAADLVSVCIVALSGVFALFEG